MSKFNEWVRGLSGGTKVGFIIGVLITTSLVFAASSPQSHQTSIPQETQKEITQTALIPCEEEEYEDSQLSLGEKLVTQQCVNGEKVITYIVTLIEGQEKNRVVKDVQVTKQPVNKKVAIGTYSPPINDVPEDPPDIPTNCDPNYSGCVPIASDVDCAGGSGNGPAFVAGPVYVIGRDIYGLDRDGNGVGCE